ncbi:MAG: YbaK/EbsC family protein [Deltaproteobacteria bacterium]|nr:YbaK/EbsC family protein [Deltaproteobacteria bacterium]
MPVQRLKDFLDKHRVKYVVITHSRAYTSQEIAMSALMPGKELAKTVMIKFDGRMVMAILPSSYKVDLDLLREATGAGKIELASENEFQDMFPECEIGAMPPFGNLYEMDVFVEESLTGNKTIAFNAGSHTELIKLAYKDFTKLVEPTVIKFSHKTFA